jgi:hypothetical protein
VKHDQDPLSILSESENGYIGVCSCCKEYNFVYKNVLLSFREEELIRFGDWLMAYRYQLDTYLPLPSGRTRVYRSPLSNLFLAFYESELDELQELFSQAKLVIEARGVLESPRSTL